MAWLRECGDGCIGDIFRIDERLFDIGDGQRERALTDRIQQKALAEVLHEPAATQDGPARPGALQRFFRRLRFFFATSRQQHDAFGAARQRRVEEYIEIAESRACGALLASAIRRVMPRADSKRVNALAFLIWQPGEETMRPAVAHKRGEGALLVDAYKRMSLRAIEEA
ncbi:hypothetical protein QCE49_21685 [Caballeronia sp. LZ008]|uniref:hypothetical protein n=1 Tax=unclassified Caballeronia TaxID=2646786 RepID=UPI00202983B7|nr:hypothetical protein [Caballeronia sp. LZ008]MDR5795994.1 hypothetical protein [Caballeronia sp. LZ008]